MLGELAFWWAMTCCPGDVYLSGTHARVLDALPASIKAEVVAAARKSDLWGYQVEVWEPARCPETFLGGLNIFRNRHAGKPLPYPLDPILGR